MIDRCGCAVVRILTSRGFALTCWIAIGLLGVTAVTAYALLLAM